LHQNLLSPARSKLNEPDASAHHGFMFFRSLRISEGVVDNRVIEQPVDLDALLCRERRVGQ
jgi:hypothetical protein